MDAKDLRKNISKGEIKQAILSLKNNKTLGIDGLPTKFYKVFIKWIFDDLYTIYNEALEKGSLGKNINKGVIKLLPKEGDQTLIKK